MNETALESGGWPSIGVSEPRKSGTLRGGDVPARIPIVARADVSVARSGSAPRQRSELVNRAMNLATSIAALLLLAPLFLIVAIAVKLTSPGPIFHIQTRIGLDRRRRPWHGPTGGYDRRTHDLGGRVFRIYKFRSMYADAEARSGAVWASKRDPRVTPLGRLLRKSRIDEFPQFFNVLRGEMNVVGPRPERPGIFARLRRDVASYHCRQRAKPGITGLAQINHTYDTCIEDVRRKVHYDLEYLVHQSLAEDLRIMLRTVPVMVLRRGGW